MYIMYCIYIFMLQELLESCAERVSIIFLRIEDELNIYLG